MNSKKKLPKVLVLMSTYNGEEFLEEQINSILNQKDVELELNIRDDGSSDGTCEVLKKFEGKDNVRIIYGENIGFAESFLKLAVEADKKYDYYAFSDQDDVWLEYKLFYAVELLENRNIPTLYCSNFWLVDEKLNYIKQEKIFDMDGLTHHNLAITNLRACGNTMVWNEKLHDYIVMYPERKLKINFHDLWIEFMAAMLGEIIIDSRRTILYRQHMNNTSGGSVLQGYKVWWKGRKKSLLARLNGTDEQKHYEEYRARYFLDKYKEYMKEEYIEDLELILNYRKNYFKTLGMLFNRVGKGVPLRVKIRIILRRI